MKKLIGVIIDSMDGEYQRRVTESLLRSAMTRKVQLSFFVGSALDEYSETENTDRTIFDLLNTRILDGVIVVPSTMVHRLEEESMTGLLGRFKDIPLVSIGMETPYAHNIILDNKGATSEVLSHILEHVNIMDLCYISGPLKNWEARQRKAAWLDLLAANGLRETDMNTYEGEFHEASGADAVDWFIQHRGGIPRGIVAANDEMAVGAYKRLAEHGYHVPSEVSLAGFDNVQLSADFFPPITTYDQRIDRLAYEAIKKVIAMEGSEEKDQTTNVSGKLIIRESCGCMNLALSPYINSDLLQQGLEDQIIDEAVVSNLVGGDFYRQFTALISHYIMPTESGRDRVLDYSDRLVKHLKADLISADRDKSFALCLSSLVNYAIIAEGRNANFSRFKERLNRLFNGLTDDPMMSLRLEEILFDCSQILEAGERHKEAYFYKGFRHMYMTSRNLISGMNNAVSQEDILRVLTEHLDRYGITSSYVVLYKRSVEYDGVGSYIYPMMSELVLGLRKGEKVMAQSFVTQNMLPTNVMYTEDSNGLIYMALNSGNVYYGYIVFSLDAIDATVYETLRSQVSESLRRYQMNMKRLEAERALNNVLRELELSNELLRRQSIRDELTGLYNRRGFYKEAEDYFNYAIEVKESFYILFGDINGLKFINDNYGHDEGDYAIRMVGDVLSACLHEDAIVARMSGDEFTALVKNVSAEEVMNGCCDCIKDRLNEINRLNDKRFDISISLGYAPYDYVALRSMDDLLRQADRNQYREKERHHSQEQAGEALKETR